MMELQTRDSRFVSWWFPSSFEVEGFRVWGFGLNPKPYRILQLRCGGSDFEMSTQVSQRSDHARGITPAG